MTFMCLQILLTNRLGPPAASVITYDALDLMWLDGLDDIRALTQTPERETCQKVPKMFKCQSMADLNWYCKWKGLAPDVQLFEQPPLVFTADLLQHLGLLRQQISTLYANMTVEMWAT